ncbi:MAG: iron-sulfur cluster-binding domain-containing protein, partial [Moraxellaceae bacterium]
MLLLAAGSGITPMISLLRQHVYPLSLRGSSVIKPLLNQQLPSTQSVQLHYWVSQREEACFIDELLALQQHQPNFSLHLYLTQSAAQQAYEQNGRIQVSHFAQQQQLANTQVLACGSAGFVASAQQILQAQVKSFQAEAFSLPLIAPSSIAPSSSSPSSIQADALDSKTVQISLQRQQRQITVPVGQSILSALEAQGIAHPSGCRMGLCNTCACAKLSGSTQHLISGEQQHDENPALRLCVSMA